jgi:hypothetical protein
MIYKSLANHVEPELKNEYVSWNTDDNIHEIELQVKHCADGQSVFIQGAQLIG